MALRNDAGHGDAYLLAVTDIPDLNQLLSAGVDGSVFALALRKVCDRLMYGLVDELIRDRVFPLAFGRSSMHVWRE
jgi:hypothetical protein